MYTLGPYWACRPILGMYNLYSKPSGLYNERSPPLPIRVCGVSHLSTSLQHLCTKTDVYPYEFLECIAFLILPNDLECIAHFQTQTAQDRLSLSTHVLNIKSENCEAEETSVKVEHNILLCI